MMEHLVKLGSAAVVAAALATSAQASPTQWDPLGGGNGHWYEFVIPSVPLTASQAEAAAEGSSHVGEAGYLATITSAEEQTFLNALWPGVGSVSGQFLSYSFFLIGASDRDSEGTFEWIGGDEEGDSVSYTNFKPGEPNNAGDEDYVVAWWEDATSGLWNDVPPASVYGAYVVEYNQAVPAVVPLPASLPLLAAGIGGLAIVRRKASL